MRATLMSGRTALNKRCAMTNSKRLRATLMSGRTALDKRCAMANSKLRLARCVMPAGCVMLASCATLSIYVKTLQATRGEKNDRQAVQHRLQGKASDVATAGCVEGCWGSSWAGCVAAWFVLSQHAATKALPQYTQAVQHWSRLFNTAAQERRS